MTVALDDCRRLGVNPGDQGTGVAGAEPSRGGQRPALTAAPVALSSA
jgi:hypothetical protein